ncbi:MAG: sigma 54-interacting transcriptional regulator [Polyangiaceae bacterium]
MAICGTMAVDSASTVEHRGPAAPRTGATRPAFVCAFPRPLALPVPDSGSVVGRDWLSAAGSRDERVSTKHIRIDRAGGVLSIADAGSRNGTWVNGARLGPSDRVTLESGAVIRLGSTLFVYRTALSGGFEPEPPVGEMIGPYGLRRVAEGVRSFAQDKPRNVLIEGETGTGKELVARAIAAACDRPKPLVFVNVAGVAAGVFESQFFGHAAGAFSGAQGAAPGVVVAHDGGTLVLDEIGELPLELQPKLLRLLENREVLPVGASRPVRVDVLVLAATHRNLEDMVEHGQFRRDLFARLSLARVSVPALRDRAEDLFSIAQALSGRAGSPLDPSAVEVEAVERLLLEAWPGNVRELDAALAAARRADPEPGLRVWGLEEALGKRAVPARALTEDVVNAAIAAAGGNLTQAAKQLGVSRGKLLRKRERAKKD